MKIALLICDYVNDDLVSTHGTLSNIFNNFIKPWNPIYTDEFMVFKGEIPPISYNADVYLISGSRHSVNDNLPWVNEFNEYLKVKLSEETSEKFIGFCWGHQILAKSLGGVIGSPTATQDKLWNVGRQEILINKRQSWMKPYAPSLSLLFNHTEHVISLPDNIDIIGNNASCEIAMFNYANKAIGIQAHPEYSNAYQESLMRIAKNLSKEQMDKAVYNNSMHHIKNDIPNKWLLNFIQSI